MDLGFAGCSRPARALAKLAAPWRGSLRRGSTDRTSGAARAFIGRLGLVITLTTMFGPPVVYGVWTTYALQQRARQLATVGARHLEAQLSLPLANDSLAQASINVLQATSIASPAVAATWVTNRQGSVLYFQGSRANWPELKVSAPIHARRFDGALNVAISTREVFIGTCLVFAAFLLLGLGAHYSFRHLPLRSLDEALRLCRPNKQNCKSRKGELAYASTRPSTTCRKAFASTTAIRNSWSATPATCTCMGSRRPSPCPARR
jgi:hypothetical protein